MHASTSEEHESTRAVRLIRRVVEASPRLGTAAAIVVGLVLSLVVAGIDSASGPTTTFVVPLALIVVVIAWLSTPAAGATVVMLGSTVWTLARVVCDHVPLTPEILTLVTRYVVLGILATLAYQLRHLVEEERDRSVHDELTGLLNRRGVFEFGAAELARAQREGRPFTLLLADIDHFKSINDTLGHKAGDAALVRFTTHAANRVRRSDVLGRLGGDEIAILMSSDAETAETVGRALIDVPAVDGLPELSASAGAVTFRTAPATIDEALIIAERLMYEAKADGSRFQAVTIG